MTWCTDARGCGKCSHCGIDMDMEPFCMDPGRKPPKLSDSEPVQLSLI